MSEFSSTQQGGRGPVHVVALEGADSLRILTDDPESLFEAERSASDRLRDTAA